MGVNLIRRPVDDVDAAAVSFPAGDALVGREVLVGVSDAPVVLFLEGIFRRIRIGIAALPELLDELLALFVG